MNMIFITISDDISAKFKQTDFGSKILWAKECRPPLGDLNMMSPWKRKLLLHTILTWFHVNLCRCKWIGLWKRITWFGHDLPCEKDDQSCDMSSSHSKCDIVCGNGDPDFVIASAFASSIHLQHSNWVWHLQHSNWVCKSLRKVPTRWAPLSRVK